MDINHCMIKNVVFYNIRVCVEMRLHVLVCWHTWYRCLDAWLCPISIDKDYYTLDFVVRGTCVIWWETLYLTRPLLRSWRRRYAGLAQLIVYWCTSVYLHTVSHRFLYVDLCCLWRTTLTIIRIYFYCVTRLERQTRVRVYRNTRDMCIIDKLDVNGMSLLAPTFVRVTRNTQQHGQAAVTFISRWLCSS